MSVGVVDVLRRLKDIDLQAQVYELREAEKVAELSRLKKEIEAFYQEILLLERVDQVLLQISTKVLGNSLTSTDTLVTAGLKLVFDDLDLKFTTKVEKSRGRTAVRFEVVDRGNAYPLLESYGGGVLAVVGVLLRVATIMAMGARRLLVLDETLAHLSEQYIGNASKLLNKVCSDLGFTILMVTHSPEFALYANEHFSVETKNGQTVLVKQSK